MCGHVEVGEHAQRFGHRDTARRRWGHPADLLAAVRRAQGFADPGAVAGQIRGGHQARGASARGVGRGGDDVSGDRSGVERGRIGGDRPQRLGVRRIAESTRLRGAVGLEEIVGRRGVDPQLRGGIGDGRRQPGADLEPVVGEPDRGAEQVSPRGAAVLGVHVGEHAHDAGHSDRAARGAGVRCGRCPVGVGHPAQVVLGGRRRRGLPPVERLHRVGGRVVVQQEATPADARGLRLDQAEDGLGGDQGVGRRAAVAQHFARSSGGQRVGGGHRVVVGVHRGHSGAVAGRGLRRGLVATAPRLGHGRAVAHDCARSRGRG